MSNVINLIQAHGGRLAGLAGSWTIFLVLWLMTVAALAQKQRKWKRSKLGIILASIFWVIHGCVWYYTIIQVLAWDHYNSVHLGELEKREQYFLIIQGATKLALAGTVSMIIASMIIVARYANAPDNRESPH